ncbi:hypothetical protein [Streptomyces sp. NPDC004296]
MDGRDHRALYEAFRAPHPGRPHAVVARVEPKQPKSPGSPGTPEPSAHAA